METISCIEFMDATETRYVSVFSGISNDPDAMLNQLNCFLDAVESAVVSPPMDDPGRLAVLYLKCYATELTGRASSFADFMKVRITSQVPDDALYLIKVDCEHLLQNGRPQLSYVVL